MLFKDFLPLIGTIVTVTAGYALVSVQVNKNRKAKWIEDFRKELTRFIVIATSLNKSVNPQGKLVNIDQSYELLGSITALTLFLIDSKEKRSKQLIGELRELQAMTLRQEDHNDLEYWKRFGGQLGKIMTIATAIILGEQKRI